MRANEQGLRSVIENVAVFAAMTFQPGNPNNTAAYSALGQRVSLALNVQPGAGTQTIAEHRNRARQRAELDRKPRRSQQKQTQSTLQTFIQGIDRDIERGGRVARS